MDGKENQDPTSTTTVDLSENSPSTEQPQLSPTDQPPARKSISPQEYIRQKQIEKETTTPTEKKSWFFDLNRDEKPADPIQKENKNSSLNTHTSLNIQSSLYHSNHDTHSSLDPHLLASTTNRIQSTNNTQVQSNSLQQNDLLASLNLQSSQTGHKESNVTDIHESFNDNLTQNSYQQKNHADTNVTNIHESFTENLRKPTTDTLFESSTSSSSSTHQSAGIAVRKQTPLQLLGQTTDQLGTQISREDYALRSKPVSLVSFIFHFSFAHLLYVTIFFTQ